MAFAVLLAATNGLFVVTVVVPSGSVLMSRWYIRWRATFPLYETSSPIFQGSSCWTPRLHDQIVGVLPSGSIARMPTGKRSPLAMRFGPRLSRLPADKFGV